MRSICASALVVLVVSLVGCDKASTPKDQETGSRKIEVYVKAIDRASKSGSLENDVYLEWRKAGGKTPAERVLEAIAKDENARENTGTSYVATREIHDIAENRARHLEKVRAEIDTFVKFSPVISKILAQARSDEIVQFAQYIQKWDYSAVELGIPESGLMCIKNEAHMLALAESKDLWHRRQGWQTGRIFGESGRFLDLLNLVRPEELGTTSREIATFIVQKHSK